MKTPHKRTIFRGALKKLCASTEFRNLAELGKQAYTTSTLQIPKALLLYLREREAAFGSRKRYFSHLVSVYGKHLGRYGFSKSTQQWKSVYQSQGQALKRAAKKPYLR